MYGSAIAATSRSTGEATRSATGPRRQPAWSKDCSRGARSPYPAARSRSHSPPRRSLSEPAHRSPTKSQRYRRFRYASSELWISPSTCFSAWTRASDRLRVARSDIARLLSSQAQPTTPARPTGSGRTSRQSGGSSPACRRAGRVSVTAWPGSRSSVILRLAQDRSPRLLLPTLRIAALALAAAANAVRVRLSPRLYLWVCDRLYHEAAFAYDRVAGSSRPAAGGRGPSGLAADCGAGSSRSAPAPATCSRSMRRRGTAAVALELAPAMAARAAARSPGAVARGDARSLPFRTQLARRPGRDLPGPVRASDPAFWREAARVLRIGGRMRVLLDAGPSYAQRGVWSIDAPTPGWRLRRARVAVPGGDARLLPGPSRRARAAAAPARPQGQAKPAAASSSAHRRRRHGRPRQLERLGEPLRPGHADDRRGDPRGRAARTAARPRPAERRAAGRPPPALVARSTISSGASRYM